MTMSRSLSRIRNLISEIEEIQRQGQQGGRLAMERTSTLKPIPESPKPKVVTQEVVTPPAMVMAPVPPQAPAFVAQPIVASHIAPDPFESLDSVVDFPPPPSSIRSNPEVKTDVSGKVFMQLSGQVVLSLQIEDSSELVELKQVGDAIEIRFADGKAVHLPLRTVA
jgi:hypothetical protein